VVGEDKDDGINSRWRKGCWDRQNGQGWVLEKKGWVLRMESALGGTGAGSHTRSNSLVPW